MIGIPVSFSEGFYAAVLLQMEYCALLN